MINGLVTLVCWLVLCLFRKRYVSVIRWKDGEALIWMDVVTRAIHSYLAAKLEHVERLETQLY